jgi:protein SCO1/2
MNTSTGHSPFRRQLLIILIARAAVIGGAHSASYLLKPKAAEPEGLQATYLPGGKPVRAFQLIDHQGQRFDNQRLKGRWTWVFFGYTHCPDACPTALAVLNAAAEDLQAKAPELPLQVVMISVDPARDTPERLAAYVPYFNKDFIGATGDDKELSALTRDLGIIYVLHKPATDGGGYLVDHSTAILLINPEGELQAIFGQPHAPQSMIDDLLQIQGHYQS